FSQIIATSHLQPPCHPLRHFTELDIIWRIKNCQKILSPDGEGKGKGKKGRGQKGKRAEG
ncbi:hypothetical protein VB713_27820, partial [Anabaena cylindrica UHCC 0172]|uniref:hypothetical protein n=1 Tax=Anabaena cylindrica TaxID=1165 RepID=UPI002B2118C8